MLSSCLKCKKNTESFNPVVSKTNNGKTIILSQCDIYGVRKSKFIKKQEPKGLLTSLGFKTGLGRILVFGDYLL